MSLLVGKIDVFLTFSEWLLSESIKPLETDFGSNPPLFNDRKYIKYKGNNVYGANFISDEKLYSVQFNSFGEVAFGVSNIVPKDIKELSKIIFSDRRIISKSALHTFNKVFFVLLQLLKQVNVDKIYFEAANKELKNIYDAMTKNKFFNQELNNIGYSNLELVEDKYVTTKL